MHEVEESGFITVWQLTTSATETLLSDEKLGIKILLKYNLVIKYIYSSFTEGRHSE